ncbi:tail fiber assembly protein [Escherichia coli]
MNYALVVENVVANIVLWDGVSKIEQDEGKLVACAHEVGIGWGYQKGKFIKPPEPVLTQEEQIELANEQRQELIASATAHIESEMWNTKLLLGRLSEEEKASFNVYLDYIDALKAVDTSTAPDITWPTPLAA